MLVFALFFVFANGQTDTIFLRKYFSLRPTERVALFRKTYPTSGFEFNIVNKDISNLSHVNVAPIGVFHHYSFENYYKLLDTNRFLNLLNKSESYFKSKEFYKTDTVNIKFLPENLFDTPNEKYFDAYLRCNLTSRVELFRKYYIHLPNYLIEVIQTDLNSLFNVKTDPVLFRGYVNTKKFNKAIQTWSKKLK